MKFLSILFAVLFLIFAVVQLNDPDPFIWVTIYGSVAVISALGALNKYYMPVLWVGMAITLIWALSLSPGVYDWFANHSTDEIFETMSPDKVFIETARECFGLLISFLVLLFHFFQARKQRG